MYLVRVVELKPQCVSLPHRNRSPMFVQVRVLGSLSCSAGIILRSPRHGKHTAHTTPALRMKILISAIFVGSLCMIYRFERHLLAQSFSQAPAVANQHSVRAGGRRLFVIQFTSSSDGKSFSSSFPHRPACSFYFARSMREHPSCFLRTVGR